MKLPNNKNAFIPKEKLIDYLLSETHPVGRSKAKFFRRLGFNETNIGKLEKSLLKIAKTNKVTSVKEFEFGTNYVIEETIKGPTGKSATIATVWFAENDKSRPSFITAYPV